MTARTLLTVSSTWPSPTHGSPTQRQRFRRLLDYAAIANVQVQAMAIEPLSWDAATAAVAAHGIEVVRTDPARPDQWQAAIRAADLVVVTDADALAAVGPLLADPDVRYVLDLATLPHLDYAAASTVLAERDDEGLDLGVLAWAAPLAAAARQAVVVIVADEAAATAVARLSPTANVRVVAPSVPVTAAADPTLGGRHGIALLAALAGESHAPDDDGARWFAEHVVPLLPPATAADRTFETVWGAGLGPRLVARALPGISEWGDVAGTDLDALLASVRAVALPRRFGGAPRAVLAELAGAGVPFVSTSVGTGDVAETLGPWCVADTAAGLARRLHVLATDAQAWADAVLALVELARRDHDPRTQRAALHHAVAPALDSAATSETDTGSAAPPPSPARTVPRPPAATLAALDRRLDDFEWRLVPAEVMRREVSRQMQSVLPADERYRLWRVKNPPFVPGPLDTLPWHPVVSIVTPVYDTDPAVLTETVESVLAQTYPHWQLCLVDDASPSHATRAVLADLVARDPRIVLYRLPQNAGIAGASNAALGLATGELVGLLDHDDVLAPDALWWVVKLFGRCPDLDLVYTDEDKLDPTGARTAPYFKPDWSPDLFLGVNYLAHFFVVRTALLREVGGWRTGFDGSQDFDLALRLTEHTDRIGHVARPLYAWRMVEGSTSLDPSAKPAADSAGQRALADAIERRGLKADVQTADAGATRYRPRYRRDGDPLVSLVIPARDRPELLRRCLDSLRGKSEVRTELVIIDNQSTDPAALDYFTELERDGATIVRYPHTFNYARQMNLGCLAATGDYLLMLNNDAVVRSDHWIESLVEQAQRPEVGVVGARLVYPDGRSQHEGIVLGMGGVAYNADYGGYFSLGDLVHNCLAVTAAVAMLRPAVFRQAGGFDERLGVAFNDVDLCLRIGELGYRVLYTPYAVIEHEESASRGSLHPTVDDEFARARWGAPRALRDPFCNQALEWFNPLMFRL
jgi:GT2 family glycosyltransferase